MSKPVKIIVWVLGIAVVLGLLFTFVLWPIMKTQTKKHSPEKEVAYVKEDLKIDLFYCSPGKKDRVIFGELVPYGEVWRTGANEATTFTTNKDLLVSGETLAAGKYTLWTIPGETEWTVIFNSKMYGWGVSFGQKASRDPDHDALVADFPAVLTDFVTENFTIEVSEVDQDVVMTLRWDQVAVPVAMQMK